jgi:hypothetical protein
MGREEDVALPIIVLENWIFVAHYQQKYSGQN